MAPDIRTYRRHSMKSAAAFALAMVLGTSVQAQERRGPQMQPLLGEPELEARFTASVEWIEAEGKREAQAVPIGADPRWLVGIAILSVEKPLPPFDQMEKRVLFVHSPALLFGGAEKAPGKTYTFKVFGHVRNGRPKFYHVEAQER
jgi:hypothetical protein